MKLPGAQLVQAVYYKTCLMVMEISVSAQIQSSFHLHIVLFMKGLFVKRVCFKYPTRRKALKHNAEWILNSDGWNLGNNIICKLIWHFPKKIMLGAATFAFFFEGEWESFPNKIYHPFSSIWNYFSELWLDSSIQNWSTPSSQPF